MHCKYLIINIDRDWKIVKNIGEVFPYHSIAILRLAFHVKPVVLSDCPSLVVPSYHCHMLRVLYFQQTKQSDHLYTVGPPINVVSQK